MKPYILYTAENHRIPIFKVNILFTSLFYSNARWFYTSRGFRSQRAFKNYLINPSTALFFTLEHHIILLIRGGCGSSNSAVEGLMRKSSFLCLSWHFLLQLKPCLYWESFVTFGKPHENRKQKKLKRMFSLHFLCHTLFSWNMKTVPMH